MLTPWRHLANSVRGTSHEKLALPCQDAHQVSRLTTSDGEALIAVVCDGAGSAKHAEVGAETVCLSILQSASAALIEDPSGGALARSLVEDWLKKAQEQIATKAAELSAEGRDLACTMLGAAITSSRAILFQVGDGAIVRWDGQRYRLVFQPDRGEYANNTYFVTEDRAKDRLQFAVVESAVDEVALLSDGLQMLAVDYAQQEAHSPFFASMFGALRKALASEDVEALGVPFLQFLKSPRINDRTDDDKTLVLATRLAEETKPTGVAPISTNTPVSPTSEANSASP